MKRVQRGMGHAFMEGKKETRLGEGAGCQGRLHSYSKRLIDVISLDGLWRLLAVVQTLLYRSKTLGFCFQMSF